MAVRRVYVEKRPGFDVEASNLYADIKENLLINQLDKVRILQRYDVEGLTDEDYEKAKALVFSDPSTDIVYGERLKIANNDRLIPIEFLPGQYNQRADSAAKCIQLITHSERPNVKVAKIIVLSGDISDSDYQKIRDYIVNPIEMRLASMEIPESLKDEYPVPEDVEVVESFAAMSDEELKAYMDEMGFAMSWEDLKFCQEYFKDVEERNPTITELRMIDTYWSDHCRHTTFQTIIEDVDFSSNQVAQKINNVYDRYIEVRKEVYGDRNKNISLMDLATIAMKYLKKTGELDNLDESEEINACSIVVKAIVDDKPEDWLIMFKNETHNHPTEVEPFGGAATCLGGAIRDPLSGRAYVYQAMRITGAADPTRTVEETLAGKLPQRVITTRAAQGYSSYGNQIGLASGFLSEIYHDDYVAKRMELGALVGAAPKANVVRKTPEAGDIIILLGGRTGRDGCGGATGSSKEHTEESLTSCGAEVQKGDAPTERNIQRLFRKPAVSRMIKRCNDFGAGGVSVAIGELADGIEINLDAVPKKYEGLDGTELAISESQERMAVVVAPENAEKFVAEAREENLEATMVALVNDSGRLTMRWRGKTIVDLSRDFLNTNGVKQTTSIKVTGADFSNNAITEIDSEVEQYRSNPLEAWKKNMARLNVCSQKGIISRFDSTVGAGTVQVPVGGEYQMTPIEGMVAKLPVESGETTTGTIMTYGYNPVISKWSPFHGAIYAVVESLARLVAIGGDYKQARLTFQEYFEKLGTDPEKWAKPFSALLGAFYAQDKLRVASIGGKDSMSGTFNDINVPPTLVSFALAPTDVTKVVSPEFKKSGNKVVLITFKKDELSLPDFESLKASFEMITSAIWNKEIVSASTLKAGGLAEAIAKMAFGNRIGVKLESLSFDRLFSLDYGSILVEVDASADLGHLLEGVDYVLVGQTISDPVIETVDGSLALDDLKICWEGTLEKVFPTETDEDTSNVRSISFTAGKKIKASAKIARPRVFMPIFPGTNCEYDVKRKFEQAGAIVDSFVFRNLTPREIEESISKMKDYIDECNIIMLPGGMSVGSEPDGSAKFIANVFRTPSLTEAVMNLVSTRDGLMLGIGDGFQALVRLGLLPYGEIRPVNADSPALTFNTIGRHASSMVRTKVTSNLSPWLSKVQVGDVFTLAFSNGEGRFVASPELLAELEAAGQIATQYVDLVGNPTMDIRYNPAGSVMAIESISSPEGRIFGKMAHDERYTANTLTNIPGKKDQKIFEAGVEYFL